MIVYTICNEYVELITEKGRVRCEIWGEGANKYIILEEKSYLIRKL